MLTETLQLAKASYEAGDYNEAIRLADDEPDRIVALLWKSAIYSRLDLHTKSRSCLDELAPLVDEAEARLKSCFYGQRGHVTIQLKGSSDAALIDYEAAKFWAIEAGDLLNEAKARNNIARLYSRAERFEEAIQEVDAALEIATRVDSKDQFGEFLDQKARILIDMEQPEQAIKISKQAINCLRLHGNETTLREATVTHGRAWVALGTYSTDPLERVRHRRAASQEIPIARDVVRLALDRTGGHVSRAAELVGISHPAMIKLIAKFGLERHPKQRRARSIACLKNKTLTTE